MPNLWLINRWLKYRLIALSGFSSEKCPEPLHRPTLKFLRILMKPPFFPKTNAQGETIKKSVSWWVSSFSYVRNKVPVWLKIIHVPRNSLSCFPWPPSRTVHGWQDGIENLPDPDNDMPLSRVRASKSILFSPKSLWRVWNVACMQGAASAILVRPWLGLSHRTCTR